MASDSKLVHELGALLGEVLAILLGALIVRWGWEDFGWGLMAFGVFGFVVSTVRVWRVMRRPADGAH